MTIPASSKLVTTVAITSTATLTKVHSFVRQSPVSSASFQASQEESGRGNHNGRVSVQPTSFEGGLLLGVYDPHLGPQCAEYLQQHLVPILDESLSTQLDHSDDDHSQPTTTSTATSNNPHYKIDPNQVIDTLKSTFRELDELLVATAITVALTQPDDTTLASADEIRKAQEVLAQVVTGSTALVGFLAPHHHQQTGGGGGVMATNNAATPSQLHDFYLAQLGDSVAILASTNPEGQWMARRLNPPEREEHSVRYKGSEEYSKVVAEAKERALTAEQFLAMHSNNGTAAASGRGAGVQLAEAQTRAARNDISQEQQEGEGNYQSFLTRNGQFLGLPVTRAFGFLDWKLEQEARQSVSTWVEAGLRDRVGETLHSGLEGTIASQEESGICNLDDPPYVVAEPKITRFVLETAVAGVGASASAGDKVLILMNRGFLYSPPPRPLHSAVDETTTTTATAEKLQNPHDQPLLSDLELSRVVAKVLEQGVAEENAAQALAQALDQARRDHGQVSTGDLFENEGSILVVTL
ncbi:hypothetical protein BG004_007394 [Podila humilis]|nr:hypothetical protein BG004_007394 [Podila humilis]